MNMNFSFNNYHIISIALTILAGYMAGDAVRNALALATNTELPFSIIVQLTFGNLFAYWAGMSWMKAKFE